MRTLVRTSLALLIALAFSTPVFAQFGNDRVSLNAAVGPSFANLGTTFSTTAALDLKLNEHVTVLGEAGIMPHAPFRVGEQVLAPLASIGNASHVNAYHWNANVKVRPFELPRVAPYLTAGAGAFAADAIVNRSDAGTLTIEDRRRLTDLATNVGAGVTYRLTDWMGLSADYRSFFVHRDDQTPRVDRLTTGVTFSLK
jgi:hypothetical protein